MREHIVESGQTEKGVQKTAVPDVHLRRLDEPLAYVREVRLKSPHEHEVDQEIDVSADRRHGDIHAAGQLGGVEHAALAVGEHGPEPPQGLGRNADAELRDVPFKVGTDEAESPTGRGRVALGQERIRETSAYPEPVPFGSGLKDVESGKLVVDNASCQRLSRLPEESLGRRTEKQELPGAATVTATPVDLPSQYLEEARHALDLVQNDEPSSLMLQVGGRIGKPGRMVRVLQVEVDAVGHLIRYGAGQGRLADLAWTQEHHRRRFVQRTEDSLLGTTLDHPR